jgi:uncharacterized membrane protein
MHFLEHFLVAAVVFVLIDAAWLKLSSNFYKSNIGDVLAAKPDLKAAAVFYILYMISLTIFAIDPALGIKSFTYALSHGALLGLVMYSTYDLTNRATLKHWPWKLVLVDLMWGTFVTTFVTTITYLVFK